MSFRGKLWVLVISGVISVYAVVGGLPFVGGLLTTSAQQPVNDSTAQMRIVESVLQHIQNDYVDDPNMEKVRLGALRGLAGGLDPYSSFLTADQVKAFDAAKASGKVGIGAEFSTISGYLYVVAAIKGSPADKAGIKAGDVIEYIDNKATRDISLYDARQLVSGDAGTTVGLRVLRSGEKPQTIKVARGGYKVPSTEGRIEPGKIGVVKVYSLEDGESTDIRTQVQSLAKQGAQKIVLDLRGVAAGSLAEGIAVANLFIKDGELAKVVGQGSKVTQTFAADPSKAVFDGPMAVLIDLGTAGAAEAVAAAVLDRKRGEVIGEKSFGAGTEQKLFPLKSGEGLLLTVAKWASPSGNPFLGEERASTGIKPSIEVKRPDTPEPLDPDSLNDDQNPNPQATPTPKPLPKVLEDIQLKKALEVLGAGDKAIGAKAGE
ncbi:MAG TPA: S41 family peptidase [Pyrinomonadaceae bacterium]|jgi:carboxyl-terminal processing protease|nr:S41 family peptidase [Pyrinomonadaceae bacterium]